MSSHFWKLVENQFLKLSNVASFYNISEQIEEFKGFKIGIPTFDNRKTRKFSDIHKFGAVENAKIRS